MSIYVYMYSKYYSNRDAVLQTKLESNETYIWCDGRIVSMYVCMYTSIIYSVSVLIKTIFPKNGKVGRGALGPLYVDGVF